MQLATVFLTILTAILATAGNPTGPNQNMDAVANLEDRLAKTYIKDTAEDTIPRSVLLPTTVITCSRQEGLTCGGDCVTHTFTSARCVEASETNCITSEGGEVYYCSDSGCKGKCLPYATCRRPPGGSCFAPDTESIFVLS